MVKIQTCTFFSHLTLADFSRTNSAYKIRADKLIPSEMLLLSTALIRTGRHHTCCRV